MLYIDGEPRSVITSTEGNGVVTYLVDGSTKALRNRERRIALNKAQALLQQLATCLRPLKAESEEPGLATEGLALLFDSIADEREPATTTPRPETNYLP